MSEKPALATPPCPHFGPCGGCQLQHLTYPAQLASKAERLRSLLAPLPLPLPELQLHPSPPLAYRNRIRLTLAEAVGQLRAGYVRGPVVAPTPAPAATGNSASAVAAGRPAPHASSAAELAFLPITQCTIAAPVLWRAAEAFLDLAGQASWLRTPQATPDQLELFTAADESQLQMTLYLRASARTPLAQTASAYSSLCEALHSQLPELAGAGIALLPAASPQRTRRAEAARPGPTWGAPGLSYPVANLRDLAAPTSYWVPRGAFFQVNRFLLPELLESVTGGRAGRLAWDLYAGVGLFSRALAASFDEVVAVEIAEPAATALAAGSKRNRPRTVKATTLDFLRAAAVQRDRPDLIVLDPPRTGAGAEVCALLARIAAPTLIYVSCSPETLPADLLTLSAAGYALTELHLFDLFPQTTHIETVAVLTR